MPSNERHDLKRKWWFFGTVGAILFESGLCAIVESAFLKHGGTDGYIWILAGTASLCLTVSGVVLLIKAGVIDGKLKNS